MSGMQGRTFGVCHGNIFTANRQTFDTPNDSELLILLLPTSYVVQLNSNARLLLTSLPARQHDDGTSPSASRGDQSPFQISMISRMQQEHTT